MEREAFLREAERVLARMVRYLEEVEALPVRSRLRPGEVEARLPERAP